jgi:autotransporter-associated beta strand protein
MKANFRNSVALVTCALSGPAAADIIYSNLQEIAIPTGNWTGVTVTVNGGTINPFFGGVGVANDALLQPARNGTDPLATLLNLPVGTTLAASNGTLNFATVAGGSEDHLGTTFSPGTEGYLGFKANGNYGWMRVVFTYDTAGAVIKDWAYDNSVGGGSIIVGRIQESVDDPTHNLVTLSPQGSEAFTLGSVLANASGKTNSVLKTGTGTTSLAATNTYTGATTIANGTLAFGNVAALNSSSALNLGVAGTSSGTLLYTGAIGDLTRNINILGNGSDTIRNSGSGLLTLSGSLTATGSALVLDGGGNGITLSGSLVGVGMDLQTLGKVSLGNNALPVDASLSVGAGSQVALTGNQTVAGLSSGSSTSAIAGSSASTLSTLTVALATGTDTFSGVLGGSSDAEKNLGLTKSGDGTLILAGSASNTFIGDTVVSGGTLQLHKDHGTAVSGALLIEGGTVEIAASGQLAATTPITLSSGNLNFGAASGLSNSFGTFTNSGGTFVTGANTMTGTGATVTWAGGTNTISNGGTTSDQHWVITGGTNTVNAGGTLAVASGSGTGTVGLYFGGTASPTVTLDSSNGTAGRILLNQNLTVDSTLTSGTAQILSSGSGTNPGFIDLQGGTRTFDINNGSATTDMLISAAVTNGGLTKTGGGTLELTGTNTFGGNTLVSQGTLALSGSGSIASSPVIAVQSGATLDVGGVTGGWTVGSSNAQTLTGSGGVTGATTIGSFGTHNAGDASVNSGVGTQNFSGALNYAAGSIFEWDLNANSTSTGFDTVGGGGAITVDPDNTVFKIVLGTNVQMSDPFWSTPGGQTWPMASIFGTSFSGSFQSVETSPIVSQYGSFTISGTDLVFTAVPEATNALVGLLVGAALMRRRR